MPVRAKLARCFDGATRWKHSRRPFPPLVDEDRTIFNVFIGTAYSNLVRNIDGYHFRISFVTRSTVEQFNFISRWSIERYHDTRGMGETSGGETRWVSSPTDPAGFSGRAQF